MDSHELLSNGLSHSQIAELMAREASLVQEKQKLEDDFGSQRARMRELFMQKEEELQSKMEKYSSLVAELEAEKTKTVHLQRELEDARSQVTIAQYTAENEIEVEKRKYKEELATVQQIMKEELCSAEDQIYQLREHLSEVDTERRHYRALCEQRIEDSDLKRNEGLMSSGVLTAMTKSLAKKVPSLSPAHSSSATPAEKMLSVSQPPASNATSPGGGEPSENLEESMKKAQEDATLLRSLLVPLEEEIAALKGKLREQDAQLRTYESQQQLAIKTSDVLGPLFQGKSSEELVQELDEKLQGVKNTLKVEKGTRADLELYVAILNTQKTALADNVERLRMQANDIRKSLDEEKRAHNDLRNTWKRANDQFLETQRQHLAYLRRIKSLLTPEQLKTLYDLQHLGSKEDEFSPDWKKESGSLTKHVATKHPHPHSQAQGQGHAPNFTFCQDLYTQLPALEKDEFASSSQDELVRMSSEETTSTALLDSGEGAESEKNSIGGETFFRASAETPLGTTKFSPEKLPQLTDDQKRALSGVGMERRSSLRDDGGQGGLLVDVESHSTVRVVSEAEWLKLEDEIRKSRLFSVENCQLCARFESQMKKAEGELRECEKEKIIYEKAVGRQKEELGKEMQYRKNMESTYVQLTEEFTKKERILQAMKDKFSQSHSRFVTNFKEDKFVLQESFRKLSLKQDAVRDDNIRLQKENDGLVGKHSGHSQQMQNEIINLPDSMEEMQLLLLNYREDVIAAKVAKESIEEKLRSEILFLKNQVSAEQHEKSSMESQLMSELKQLRDNAAIAESLQVQLSTERDVRPKLEAKVRELEKKSQDTLNRSQQFITGLKTEVEDQKQSKKKLENATLDLRSRVTSLQQDLKTSEAVQRDFVRLSQSLQVQLEKIRQSEKEVRWQHEDDVEECNNCNQRFTAVARRKHHCRHCGKIFCADCVTKTVSSGPQSRTSKVCDVCHTLLVQDATPFFSTEPPQSPG